MCGSHPNRVPRNAASSNHAIRILDPSCPILLHQNLHLPISLPKASRLQLALTTLTSWTVMHHLVREYITINAEKAPAGLAFIAGGF